MGATWKHSFFTRINPFNGHVLAAFDSGHVFDVDEEIVNANREFEECPKGSKEEHVIRGKIEDLVKIGHVLWSVLPSGKAGKRVSARRGGVGVEEPAQPPRFLPPDDDEEAAILRDLVGPGRVMASKRIYPFARPKNPHRGEYRRAKVGARNNEEFWEILHPEYKYQGEGRKNKLTRQCACGCGRHTTRGLNRKCVCRIKRNCYMVELGVMSIDRLSPKEQEYYLARKHYPWLRIIEWFGKGR